MIVDIINKKRLGKELSFKELDYFFNGYLNGDVKDYQMSALLMAICINGMKDEEIYALTKIFIDSGDILDLSFIDGVKVDKHSTGGVGDKTTLIIAPIVASLGIPVIKMSGRGLGYTGGTIDKLESIPGFNIALSDEEIMKQASDIGIVLTGQTASLATMDKYIYALRDVTGTVSSIPLIATSIMSKKIASGADKIVIDIKVGKGALLQTKKDANKLSEVMKKIGSFYHREVKTIISDMNTPLGHCIGNALEVSEAVDLLKGKIKSGNLYTLCTELAGEMISLAKGISKWDAVEAARVSLEDGSAYKKFMELVSYQGGDISKLEISKNTKKIRAKKSGVLESINALELAKLSLELGAGRKSKEDKIDYSVGIKLNKNVGDIITKGQVLATIYYNSDYTMNDVDNYFTIK